MHFFEQQLTYSASVSVLIAVIIVMVDTSLHRTSKPPSAFQINPNDTYPSRVTGVMNIVLAYGMLPCSDLRKEGG
jgi:hypothetical protein